MNKSKLNFKEISYIKSQFFKEWVDILSFANKKPAFDRKNPLIKKIPLLDLEINPFIFHKLWVDIYPLFMNQNPITLEIITEKKSIKHIFLHKANKLGMYEELIPIEISKIPINELDSNELDSIYEKCKLIVKNEYNLDLGNIRIISESLIDRIVNCYNQKKYSFKSANYKNSLLSSLFNYLDIIIEAIDEKEFLYYPESLIFDYLYDMKKKYSNTQFFNIIQFIEQFYPLEKFTITLKGKDYNLTYKTTIKRSKISTELCSGSNDFPHSQNLTIYDTSILKSLKKKYNTNYNFIFDIGLFIAILKEVFLSSMPISLERKNVLFQKFLDLYRSKGKSWNCYPTPLIFNEFIRYTMYASGVRFNPNKISHWALPEILSFQNYFIDGTFTKILYIVGNKPNSFKTLVNFGKKSSFSIFLITFENSAIKNFTKFSENKLFDLYSSVDFQSKLLILNAKKKPHKIDIHKLILEQFRAKISEEFGFINRVKWMSYNLFSVLINNLFFNLHSSKLFPLRFFKAIIKSFKDSKEFLVFPDTPLHNYISSESDSKILKKYSRISTDQMEF